MIGLYVPGASPLHRSPVGVKLGVLMLSALAILLARTPQVVGASLLATLVLYAVARIPWRTALAQVRPVLWFGIPVLLLQWILSGPAHAFLVVGQLVVLVGMAALVTLTTRVTAMLDAFETALRPLRRVGVSPERIALVLALTIRFVPVVAEAYAQAREARRARGLESSPLALAVPLVIRLLRKADHIGEGLAARGCD
ncbi:MAG TPA: energy-coupling factor transporter transmembrane protein EcfT [Actinopolymorphaceae bacterium]